MKDDQEIEVTILKGIIADIIEILDLPILIPDKIDIKIVAKTQGVTGSVNNGQYLILIGEDTPVSQLKRQLALVMARLYLQEHKSSLEVKAWVIQLIDQYLAIIHRLKLAEELKGRR